jgi:Flp pilus assembly protein TadG
MNGANEVRMSSVREHAWSNERGSIMVFVGLSLVIMLAMGAMAVDMGRAYLHRARLARAVDAAALAGARVLREGQATAQSHALAIAQVNGVGNGTIGSGINVQFGVNGRGESTVNVIATETVSTLFAKVIGISDQDIVAGAEAATPPVDLVLVIDHSGSLASAGAWTDLQDAATDFVDKFDDSMDQVGLVGFSTRADQRTLMQSFFTAPVQSQIWSMSSAGWTNTGEALRMAHEQFTTGPSRQQSAKVVVLFTDGQPTAFRGNIGDPGAEQDRIIAAPLGGFTVSGYWDNPMVTIPADGNAPVPDGCLGTTTCFGTWTNASIGLQAHDDGRAWASAIRGQGIYIYTIGLGWAVQSYLEEIANQGGIANPSQLQGRSYIAPTAADLDGVFDLVASDIFVRLAK